MEIGGFSPTALIRRAGRCFEKSIIIQSNQYGHLTTRNHRLSNENIRNHTLKMSTSGFIGNFRFRLVSFISRYEIHQSELEKAQIEA